MTAVLNYIFLHTGRRIPELLSLPTGERAIYIAGAKQAMEMENRMSPALRFEIPKKGG